MNMLTIEFRDQTDSNSKKDLSFSLALLAALICTMLFWTPASYGHEANDMLEPVNRLTMNFNKAVDTVFFKPVANVAHIPTSITLQAGRAQEIGEPGNMEVTFEE